MTFLGNRINSSWLKRMTLQESFCTQEYSFDEPIFFYCIVCIGRAGWSKTTVLAQEGRQQLFVPTDQ
jgi:hypothetical protein